MSTTGFDGQKREEFFCYFALYHTLAHWTAYLTILALLLTIGVVVSSTNLTHPKSAAVAIVILWGIEIYLAVRIAQLGAYIRGKLSNPPYRLELIPNLPWVIGIGATIFAGWDFLLVIGRV